MKQKTIAVLIIFLLSGCFNPKEPTDNSVKNNDYARGFSIENTKNSTMLTVFNPWEKAKNISVKYYLLKKGVPLPDSLSGKNIIQTPVQRVVCLSTTHLAFLAAIEETDAVVGVSGSGYVTNSKIRKKIDEGDVPDVGYGQNLNYEQIVTQEPDLVMVYGVGSEVTNYTRKLEEMGIPSVMIGEYLEEKPLGKAEWIKFIATLFEKESEANAFFSHIEKEYLDLKKRVASRSEKPNVLVGSPYKDSWWVPGGNSYLAHLISDAGGNYPGKKNQSNESYIISFENALAWGSKADVWINMGNLSSKKEILAADERFKNLKVFNDGKIFNNIKRLSPHGGNDFWESGTVHPHWILKDLISVFYPKLFDEEMVYYEEIK